MTVSFGNSTLYSGQRNPPPLKIRTVTMKLNLRSSDPQHPSYPLFHCGVQEHGFIEKTACPLGLPGTKVAFANLYTHDFASAGYIETGLGSLVCLYLRHLQFLLPSLYPFPSPFSPAWYSGDPESRSLRFLPWRAVFPPLPFPQEQ